MHFAAQAKPSDPVEERDARSGRRNGHAERDEQGEKAARLQRNALTTHVRSGQHGRAGEIEIDRNEAASGDGKFVIDRQKTRALETQRALRRDARRRAIVALRKVHGRERDVKLADRNGGGVHSGRLPPDDRRELRANALLDGGNRIECLLTPPQRRQKRFPVLDRAEKVGRRFAHDAQAGGQRAVQVGAHDDELVADVAAPERLGDPCGLPAAYRVEFGLRL